MLDAFDRLVDRSPPLAVAVFSGGYLLYCALVVVAGEAIGSLIRHLI
jgi:hypothetical protein